MPAKVETKTVLRRWRFQRSVMIMMKLEAQNQVWLLFCPSLVLEWFCSCVTGSPQKVREDAYGLPKDSEAQWSCVTHDAFV